MRKFFYPPFIFLFLSHAFQSTASHIIGGEISYICSGNSNYEITLRVYRDCYNGIPPLDNPAYYTIFNASGGVVANSTVSLGADSFINNAVLDTCFTGPQNICLEEGTYVFTVNLPPIIGGYTIVYQRCCRSALNQNLLDPTNRGSTYTAQIPDMNLATCNNSPYSNAQMPEFLCLETPFTFDASVTDIDGDSIAYQLCSLYDGASPYDPQPTLATPPPYYDLSYLYPYSATEPMSSSSPISLNQLTGELNVTPVSIGSYAVGICANEFRNGNLLSTHRRDFLFTVLDCGGAQIPVAAINVCNGFTATFSNSSDSSLNFHWDFGVAGNSSDTSNAYSPSYTYSAIGNYTASVIVSQNQCSDTVYVDVHIISTAADFIYAGGGVGSPIQFTDMTTATFGNADSWSWNFGDGFTSTIENPSHTYSAPGIYNVKLVVHTTAGCLDSVTKSVALFATGINSSTTPAFLVHPNPVEDELIIELPGKISSQKCELRLSDETGRVVMNSFMNPGAERNQVSVTSIPDGTYFLQIKSDESVWIQKVVIEK